MHNARFDATEFPPATNEKPQSRDLHDGTGQADLGLFLPAEIRCQPGKMRSRGKVSRPVKVIASRK